MSLHDDDNKWQEFKNEKMRIGDDLNRNLDGSITIHRCYVIMKIPIPN